VLTLIAKVIIGVLAFGLKPFIESLHIPRPEGWGYRDFNNPGLQARERIKNRIGFSHNLLNLKWKNVIWFMNKLCYDFLCI
jgi:hypothetical protein